MSNLDAAPTPGPDAPRLWAALRPDNLPLWTAVAVLIAAIFYLSTFQTIINGGGHPYVTDVGEHQNALPRWGLIHHSGYPQWSALGSLFVTILRLFGVAPAAAVSLWSLFWGLVTVALLVWLAFELGASGPFAALGALAAGLTTSMWVDASIGELHTMTTALTTATLIFALRFGRSGARADLLWLTFVFSQGVFHQRSILLLAPAVLLLIWPHVLTPFRLGRRTLLLVIGVALLAPLSYLYLPLRVWMGTDWVFGSPGTWDGFWALFFDNRAERVFDLQTDWLARLRTTLEILHDDLWLPLLAVGLAGLWLNRLPDDRIREEVNAKTQGREGREKKGSFLASLRPGVKNSLRVGLALTAAWLPNFLLTVLIWRNRVTDGQLAAKLPVLLLAGVGLALALEWLRRRWQPAGALAALALAGGLAYWAWTTRPFVLGITRDDSSQAIVAAVERVAPDPAGRATTVVVPWGTDYWTLTYEQAFGGRLDGLRLVDHNARPADAIARGDRLLLPDQTLRIFPLSTFEERLGPLFLASAAPGVIEISPAPILDERELALDSGIYPAGFDLGNGARVWGAATEWVSPDQIALDIYWRADRPLGDDYSTAVHLVSHDPPAGPADILSQADRAHPVDGWYPTTRWRTGEIVRDSYLLEVPSGSAPVAIRVAMYRNDPTSGFINTPWLSLPLPAR
jgi:hypothetical protein